MKFERKVRFLTIRLNFKVRQTNMIRRKPEKYFHLNVVYRILNVIVVILF